MAITLETLYYDFRSNYQDKPEYSINFYTDNALFFNNLSSFKNIDALRMYIQITCRYVNALFNKSRFNECIEACDKNLSIINNEILKLNINEVRDDWYLAILFADARSYYNLKDFKRSTALFKSLLWYDPKNESYKNWLNYSKYRRISKYFNISAIIIPICVLVEIFFKNPIPRVVMRSIFVVYFLIFITILSYNYYLERTRRKKTKK